MPRNIGNRSLRERFFGFVFHKFNDNFEISQLKATIEREEKNLDGRKIAAAKYQRYATMFERYPTIKKQSLEMAEIEMEAIPKIQQHIDYLKSELVEELLKEQ